MAKTKTSSKAAPRTGDASPSVATMRSPGTNSSAPAVAPSIAKAPAAATPAPRRTAPTHEQIAKRAYEIWVSRGRPVGRDVENWKQAERELGAN